MKSTDKTYLIYRRIQDVESVRNQTDNLLVFVSSGSDTLKCSIVITAERHVWKEDNPQ